MEFFNFDPVMLESMQMTALGKNLSGALIESDPYGHTKNTCPHTAGTVVGNEDHHKLRNVMADGDQALHVKKKNHVLAIDSDASVAS